MDRSLYGPSRRKVKNWKMSSKSEFSPFFPWKKRFLYGKAKYTIKQYKIDYVYASLHTRIGDSTTGEWISCVSWWATAIGDVKTDLAQRIWTAESNAWIDTSVLSANLRRRTIIVDCENREIILRVNYFHCQLILYIKVQ